MLLQFADGDPFATGAAGYSVPTSGPAARRITLQVKLGEQPTTAIVDTGSPLLICHPDLAYLIGFDHSEALESKEVLYRNEWVGGFVHRAQLTLLADQGNPLHIDASVLVPDPEQDFVENFFPASFLGMRNCLESVRFAIDPSDETFYFGERP